MDNRDLKIKKLEGNIYSPLGKDVFKEIEKDLIATIGTNVEIEKVGTNITVKLEDKKRTYMLKTQEQNNTLFPITKPDVLIYKVEIY